MKSPTGLKSSERYTNTYYIPFQDWSRPGGQYLYPGNKKNNSVLVVGYNCLLSIFATNCVGDITVLQYVSVCVSVAACRQGLRRTLVLSILICGIIKGKALFISTQMVAAEL
jgi:hypothetical protein